VLLENVGERDGLVEVPTAVGPFDGGDADEKGPVLGPLGANGVDGFDEQADTVFEAATVAVCPPVGERRQELVEQVTMGRVDLDDVESAGKCAACGRGEGFRDPGDARGVEFVRPGVLIVEGDGAGSRDVGPAIFAG
jgi:hypothetical protein